MESLIFTDYNDDPFIPLIWRNFSAIFSVCYTSFFLFQRTRVKARLPQELGNIYEYN